MRPHPLRILEFVLLVRHHHVERDDVLLPDSSVRGIDVEESVGVVLAALLVSRGADYVTQIDVRLALLVKHPLELKRVARAAVIGVRPPCGGTTRTVWLRNLS